MEDVHTLLWTIKLQEKTRQSSIIPRLKFCSLLSKVLEPCSIVYRWLWHIIYRGHKALWGRNQLIWDCSWNRALHFPTWCLYVHNSICASNLEFQLVLIEFISLSLVVKFFSVRLLGRGLCGGVEQPSIGKLDQNLLFGWCWCDWVNWEFWLLSIWISLNSKVWIAWWRTLNHWWDTY